MSQIPPPAVNDIYAAHGGAAPAWSYSRDPEKLSNPRREVGEPPDKLSTFTAERLHCRVCPKGNAMQWRSDLLPRAAAEIAGAGGTRHRSSPCPVLRHAGSLARIDVADERIRGRLIERRRPIETVALLEL
jgi:hypothetical protein